MLTAVTDLRRRVDAAAARRFAELSEVELRADAALAVEFLDAAVDGRVDWPQEDVFESAPVDEWLMNLPGLLVHAGLLTEARVVAEHAVEVDPKNDVMYLGDLAQSLAEAGLDREAAEQAEANLGRFPDESWVLITSGFALARADPERAESLFRKALALARPEDDPSGYEEIYEHYIEFLGGREGRDAEQEAARRQLASWRRSQGRLTFSAELVPSPAVSRPVARAAPKVGRNEPCPCGSGRKYKRCCGA
jgi:tetratricopeptide (TPR) repeat protein